MDIQKTCCFTGHRPKTLPFLEQEQHPKYKELERLWNRELQTLIEEEGVRHFISGMAIGFDLFAAEKILNLKKTYPELRWKPLFLTPSRQSGGIAGRKKSMRKF